MLFKIFKPKSRFKADDEYKTKPQLAIEILQEVKALGFQVELVLADSLYGESGDVIWFIMTDLPRDILRLPGLYTLRTWIEYGFKQVKDELGWADFRLTAYSSIERSWEVVFSAYLLVTLPAERFKVVDAANAQSVDSSRSTPLTEHLRWKHGTTWKRALNNLRLLLQAYVSWGAMDRWLEIFSIPGLKRGLFKLMDKMDEFSILPQLQAQVA